MARNLTKKWSDVPTVLVSDGIVNIAACVSKLVEYQNRKKNHG